MSDSFAAPRTVALQAPLSMGFSRQEYWSGLPFPSPGDLPDPGIKPRPPALQANSLPSELLRKCYWSKLQGKSEISIEISNDVNHISMSVCSQGPVTTLGSKGTDYMVRVLLPLVSFIKQNEELNYVCESEARKRCQYNRTKMLKEK